MNLVKASRETLLKPLQAVSGIIERRHTLPILSNVLIHRTGKRLAFVATDIEVEISAESESEAQGDATGVTVGARKLLDILRALPDQSEITLSLADRRLQAKSGKSKFQLQTLPPEDFPRLAAPEGAAVSFELPQTALKRLLALVQYAMAQQDIRYYLNGMLVVVDSAELRVVATDGHRLALVTRPIGATEVGHREVILPRKTIMELSKLLSDAETPVMVELFPSQARFRFDGVVLTSKLVDGKFPDYQRVIPAAHSKRVRVNRQALAQALQRAAILTSDKFRGVRWVLSENNLRITCNNAEQEEAQEELELQYQGEALDIGFNVQYLLDVLTNLDADEIDIDLGDANSSAVVTVVDRTDFKYVVMPMRI
jgi:DNA polymerase-3 subunit beta